MTVPDVVSLTTTLVSALGLPGPELVWQLLAALGAALFAFLFLVLFAVGRSFWFMLLVFLLAGLMRTIKEPVLAAWMNDHVDEKMRATVFSTSGQLDSFGQIIGGPIVGLVAQQVSIPWGLVCTAFLLLPALFLVPVAGKKRD